MKKKHRKKLFRLLERYQEAVYTAGEKETEKFLKETTWLGHESTEHGIKPNKEKMTASFYLKLPISSKKQKPFLRAIQILQRSYPSFQKNRPNETIIEQKLDWKWTERKEENFSAMKMITELPRWAHFARGRNNIVTTNESWTGLGITLRQRQNDDTIQPKAFVSRHLNDAQKNDRRIGTASSSMGIRELSFIFIRQSSTSIYRPSSFGTINKNRTYWQNNSRLTRWLYRLAHFDNSIKHTEGKNLAKTVYLSRHPTEEAITEETHGEENVNNIISELFELKHKNGQLLNTIRKFLSIRQSTNMTLMTNREPTNEIA